MARSGEMTGLRASPAELSLEPGVSGPARDSDLELGFMSRPAWGSSLGPAVHVDGQAVPVSRGIPSLE